MASAALASAQQRRAQLVAARGVGVGAGATPGVKRSLKNHGSPPTATTAASGSEQVTPDPKHVKIDDQHAPSPKQLFASPNLAGESMEVEKGGGVEEKVLIILGFD